MNNFEKKKDLILQIQNLFKSNHTLASFSIFINTQFCDNLFQTYIKSHLGKIDLNDIHGIQNMLESVLQIQLNQFVNLDEMMKLYFFSKSYIDILLNESN